MIQTAEINQKRSIALKGKPRTVPYSTSEETVNKLREVMLLKAKKDQTLYQFRHQSGTVDVMTRNEFAKRHGLRVARLGLKPDQQEKTYKEWAITKHNSPLI